MRVVDNKEVIKSDPNENIYDNDLNMDFEIHIEHSNYMILACAKRIR